MIKAGITDMTYGSPAKHILFFSLPALMGSIFQQIYTLADSIIVGRFIGSNAFAAVGATSSITFLFFALCNGTGSGGGIIVSQYYGAHNDDKVKNCIINTGLIMLMVPVIFGMTGFILAPAILKLLGTPALILEDAVLYTRYMSIGLLFVSLYNYLASILRALGDSKTPLYFLILSTIVNIILDIAFICFLSMGIKGAALATVISQLISVLGCGVYACRTNRYFKFQKRDLSITLRMSYHIIRLGIPLSIQFGLIAISSMAVQRIVNSYGTVVVAAFTATNRIEQIIHQPYMSLGTSLSTFCGQNYGAEKNRRVYSGYKAGIMIMVLLSVVLILCMQLFSDNITGIFVSDPDVVSLSALGLRINSAFYLALGMIYVIRGVLSGIGDAFFPLLNGIVEIIGRFTLPLFMTSYLGYGETGIWLSCGIVWFLSGFTAWLRYISYSRKILGPVPNSPDGPVS